MIAFDPPFQRGWGGGKAKIRRTSYDVEEEREGRRLGDGKKNIGREMIRWAARRKLEWDGPAKGRLSAK